MQSESSHWKLAELSRTFGYIKEFNRISEGNSKGIQKESSYWTLNHNLHLYLQRSFCVTTKSQSLLIFIKIFFENLSILIKKLFNKFSTLLVERKKIWSEKIVFWKFCFCSIHTQTPLEGNLLNLCTHDGDKCCGVLKTWEIVEKLFPKITAE